MKSSHLDAVDRQLLHALTVAPRAPFRLLAEVIGVSDQTIARRYRRLAETVGLRVYGLIDGERAGWVDWIVRLQATPGSAQGIAAALAQARYPVGAAVLRRYGNRLHPAGADP